MTRSTPWKRDGDAGQVPDRPQVRVEIERLAQADVHAREALADRRRHRSLERDLVAADRVDQLHRQRLAGPLEREDAGVVRLPVDRDARRLEDADDRVGDLGSDAVAGNQRDGVCHSRTYQIRRIRPRPRLTVWRSGAASGGAANAAASRDREHQHRDRRPPDERHRRRAEKLEHEQAGDDDRAAGVGQVAPPGAARRRTARRS